MQRAVGLIVGMVLTFGLHAAAQTDLVLLVEVDGPITPVIADHLADAVDEATARRAVLVDHLPASHGTPARLDTMRPREAGQP